MRDFHPTVITEEVALAGKPAAVSLIAEGYATIAAIRAKRVDDSFAEIESGEREFTLSDALFDQPSEIDKARGTQLGQLIKRSKLFKGSEFSRSYYARSRAASPIASSTLLEYFQDGVENNVFYSKKAHAEICLAGLHGYAVNASIPMGGGAHYKEGVTALEILLAMHDSTDQQLTKNLKDGRPEDGAQLEGYFESVLGLSQEAIDLMATRASLIRRYESIPARLRHRLRRKLS